MAHHYTLYGRSGAGSLAPQIILEEMGLPYKMEWIDGEAALDPASPYRRICPTGKIPALTLSDGSSMFESAAICTYLTDIHSELNLAPMRGTIESAQFLQWMSFLATSVYGSALRWYYAPRYTTRDDAEGTKEAALHDFDAHLQLIENNLSGYLVGEKLSAADFYLYMLVGWHPDEYQGVRKRFPKIGALCEKIAARPAVKKVMTENS